jgi:cation transport ATPase
MNTGMRLIKTTATKGMTTRKANQASIRMAVFSGRSRSWCSRCWPASRCWPVGPSNAGRFASNAVVVGFAIVAYVFGGFFTVREAIENIRAKRFEIDTLMLVAAAGAAALGKWTEGGLLLFLFSLGHSLEHYAMGRARRAIEALAKLAPERRRCVGVTPSRKST